jgi:predicted nucleic acid-binding protein
VDVGVISLYFAGQASVKPYFDRITSGKAAGLISEVNLAEYYHKSAQILGLETAEVRYTMLRRGAFVIVAPDETITRGAGIWKVRRPDLSLADCFALSTLEARGQTLLTTDLPLSKVKGINAVYFSP